MVVVGVEVGVDGERSIWVLPRVHAIGWGLKLVPPFQSLLLLSVAVPAIDAAVRETLRVDCWFIDLIQGLNRLRIQLEAVLPPRVTASQQGDLQYTPSLGNISSYI